MLYKHAFIAVIFIALFGLSSLTYPSPVLQFSENEDNPPSLPLKPKDTLYLKVKNNAPVAHQVTLTAENAEITGPVTLTIPPRESKQVIATVTQFGEVKVYAKAAQGGYQSVSNTYLSTLRMATFNLSFDRNSFEELVEQMGIPHFTQESMVEQYRNGDLDDDEVAKKRAEQVIQIRNVAEIIQRVKPDILLLAEFNNDGKDTSNHQALDGFQTNYLSQPQHDMPAIIFEYKRTFGTNTGLLSPYDLNHSGGEPALPDDAWGFGQYHGQYAFALFSKYPLDDNSMRSFQQFKWKDIPGEIKPVIDLCNDPEKFPEGMKCGDNWYSDDAWNNFRLSSKNHIDIPVKLPVQKDKERSIHLLLSHPTPPVFDGVARHNYKRNSAEVRFWHDYIEGKTYFIDDQSNTGGLAENSLFIIAGDLNADPDVGDGDRTAIANLLSTSRVNTSATTGDKVPTSKGGSEFLQSSDCTRNCNRDKGNTITSDVGLAIDHIIPSTGLVITDSGVFWPAKDEPGRYLVDDDKLGFSKGVSSDHRLVWLDFYIRQ